MPPVQVSGLRVGEVSSIELDGPQVLVKFTSTTTSALGDRTEAAIKTKSLLGSKILEVTPRGDGAAAGPIPLERTTSPYQLPDALGDLATNDQRTEHRPAVAIAGHVWRRRSPTPRRTCKVAVAGVARFSQTLNDRDAQLRNLLTNANKATKVLAERSDQMVGLIANTNALLAQLQTQSAALDQISGNVSAVAQQLKGFIAENRAAAQTGAGQAQRRADDRRQPQGQGAGSHQGAQRLRDVAGRVGGVGTVLQGLHRQPVARAVRSAVRRCRVLRPGPGSAHAAALAAHRSADRSARRRRRCRCPTRAPGRAASPRLNLPDAITGKPGDQACGPPGLPLPGPTAATRTASRCPRRRPAGRRRTAGAGAARTAVHARPTPSPVYVARTRRGTAESGQGDAMTQSAGRPRSRWPIALVVVLAGGCRASAVRSRAQVDKHARSPRISTTATACYAGDDVRILGVPVGKIDKIEPQPQRAKITFWVDDKYKVPADAKAVDPVARRWSRRGPSS